MNRFLRSRNRLITGLYINALRILYPKLGLGYPVWHCVSIRIANQHCIWASPDCPSTHELQYQSTCKVSMHLTCLKQGDMAKALPAIRVFYQGSPGLGKSTRVYFIDRLTDRQCVLTTRFKQHKQPISQS